MNPIHKRKILLSLLLLILLLFSVGSILYKKATAGSSPGIANIYQDGILIKSIPLEENSSATFTVEGEGGAFNQIEVADGKISVIEASCPDQICVKQGAIQNDLIPITCLPNHLVICIEEETATDIVAY